MQTSDGINEHDFVALADEARKQAHHYATMPFAEEYTEWREMYETLEAYYLRRAEESHA